MNEKGALDSAPLVSMVIPTRSRPKQLKLCLTALSQQGEGVPKEVVVVDDGSPLKLAAEIEASLRDTDARLLRQQGTGPAAARNRGAAATHGKLLVFIDDDCQPEPGWLDAIVREFNNGDPILVGGPIINASTTSLFSEATQLLVDYVSHRSVAAGLPWRFIPSCNLAISRESFDRLGGFNESFTFAGGEDREFCSRALKQGLEIRFVKDVTVRHFHDLNLAAYVQQHLRYGRGAVLYRRRLPAGHGALHVPLRWYLQLIAIPFDGRKLTQAVPLVLVLALAQLVTAVGAARQSAGRIRFQGGQ